MTKRSEVMLRCRRHTLTEMPMILNAIRTHVWTAVRITANPPESSECETCLRPAVYVLMLDLPTPRGESP